jgi:hypothetical protein
MQKHPTGPEGLISHLGRGYGMDRSCLKGDEDQQIWTGWTILTCNIDTLVVRERDTPESSIRARSLRTGRALNKRGRSVFCPGHQSWVFRRK